jgi:hypothetical protein
MTSIGLPPKLSCTFQSEHVPIYVAVFIVAVYIVNILGPRLGFVILHLSL